MTAHGGSGFSPTGDRKSSDDPPGTVQLVSDDKGKNGGKLLPIPKPSNDPDDPLRWVMGRKIINFMFLSAMTIFFTSGSSIQTVLWGQMRKELSFTTGQLLTAKAINLIGEAVACLIFLGFATKYGRRPLYILTTIIFTAAAWWSAYMNTVPELFLTNALKGLASTINKTAVQMSIRDMFFIHQRGTATSIYITSLTFGASMTPLAAGAQATAFGWRSCYFTLAIVMTVFTALLMFGYEETKFVRPAEPSPEYDTDYSNDSVESFQDKRLQSREASPPLHERKPFPHYLRLQFLTPTDESLWKIFYQPFLTLPIPQVLLAALIFGVDLNLTFTLGSMRAIVLLAPPYEFTPLQLGLMDLTGFIGSIFGSIYGGICVDKAIQYLARRNNNIFEPEMRLYFMPLPAALQLAGYIIFGATADQGMFWLYPAIGSTLCSMGFAATASIMFSHIIDCYPDITAPTFAIISLLKTCISMIGAFTLESWRNAMSVTAIFVIAAFAGAAVHCFVIPMAIWGKKIRAANAERYRHLANGKESKRK